MGRHRLGVLATAALLALFAGLSLAAVRNAARAERARAEATLRFRDAHRAARTLMFDVLDRLERRPGTLRLRVDIAHLAERYLDRLAASPGAPPAVKLDLANGYLRAAMATGVGTAPNLGDYARAKRDLADAAAILARLRAGPVPAGLGDALARVAGLQCRTQIYGDHDARRALAAARRGLADPLVSADPAARWPVRLCEGDALVWLDRAPEAVRLLAAELDAAGRRRPPPDPATLAANLRFLGEAFFYAGDYASAERAFGRALAILGELHARQGYFQETVNEFAGVSDDLAATLENQRRFADELRVARRGHALAQAQAALDPDDLQSERRALSLARVMASALAHLGRADEAIRLMDGVDRRWRVLVARFPDDSALARLRVLSLRVQGDLRRQAGRRAEACAMFRYAAGEWAAFGRRWGISPSDLREDVQGIQEDLRACPPRADATVLQDPRGGR